MQRRQILIAGAGYATLLAAAPALVLAPPLAPAARAEAGEVYDDDRVLGSADAKVTIIEYSSLTCPHCASFHASTLPELKKQWIDEGKARLVFRHFPLDGLALRAAAVTNCMEGERSFSFLEALFRNQQRWSRAEDPMAALSQMAKLAGMDQAAFDACVADEAAMNQILTRAREGAETYDVQSTPTFIVNGKKVTGALGYEDFEKVLKEAEGAS